MWFEWALLTAIISSISYVLSKHLLNRISTLVVTWSLFIFSMPVLILLVSKQGIPMVKQAFLIAVLISGIGFALAKTATLLAIKKSTISKIIPLNATNVMVTYVISLFMLREIVGPLKILGLILIIAGIYWINISKTKESWLAPLKELKRHKASFIFLIATLVMGGLVSFNKLAIINTDPVSPIFVLLIENIISVIVITFLLWHKNRWIWLNEIGQFWPELVLMSLIYIASSITVFYGFATGPTALVLGIKKLQILFAMLWAWLFLKDQPKKEQIGGAVIMIVGVVLVKL